MPNYRNHSSLRIGLQSWFVLILVICSVSASAQSIVLHLKNGDRISGSLLSETTNSITIATPYSEKLVVPTQQINRREELAAKTTSTNASAGSVSASPAIAGGVTGSKSVASTNTTAAVKPGATNKVAATTVKAAPSASNAALNPMPPWDFKKFLSEWKGEVQAGVNLAFSSKDRQLYTGRFRATHSHKSLRNILDYNASYGRTEGILSDNRMDGSWKLEYDLSKRFLIYNAAGAGYDEIRKIEFQYDVGPGVGYKWLVKTNFVLKSELGGNYQEQLFSDNSSKRRYSLRLAEDAWWQITDKIRWDEKLEFFPQIDDLSDFRVRAESNLSYLLRNNLTLNVSVIELYDTAVLGNVTHNDLQIRSTIGIKF